MSKNKCKKPRNKVQLNLKKRYMKWHPSYWEVFNAENREYEHDKIDEVTDIRLSSSGELLSLAIN